MADEDTTEPQISNGELQDNDGDLFEISSSSSSSAAASEYDSDDSGGGVSEDYYDSEDDEAPDDDTPESNIKRFTEVLESRSRKRKEEEEDREYEFYEDLFDFPKDPENWTEEDLKELWADGPIAATKPGWDPLWADEEDWDIVMDEIEEGDDPAIAPFYLPYRKYYPAIPDNHYDISNPKAVIEELDRIEEFLKWVSYIFPDGSSYEGTAWDDLAHGKGVYVAEHGLVRYEGEWLQNNMEGHGVVEVDIPDVEPYPGSKLEAKMRAEGRIISRDFMSPEDREWLEMDIEDSYKLANGRFEIPFYENKEWTRLFGSQPEKGRYRYAGQWKHGRMHGCGVYEVNERPIFGRFYFGQMLEDSTGCDADISTLHAGIAEVAAAKARMFTYKPDGMIREQRGPYSDPQHPYMYEEEDVWMAPGFINQFYEVPDYWKTYAKEVDQEREMWLNSFYKSPLRIPMPAELEHWWAKDERPEFILINKEPEPDPEDPSKLIYTEDPLILHTKSGRLINYIEDEKYGVRLFWQPPLKEGEDVDPKKAEFLPLGFDEFYGIGGPTTKEKNILERLISSANDVCKSVFEKLEKWADEKKKDSDLKLKLIEHELEFIEAEICLNEAIEDMETLLKKKQEEEEKKEEIGEQDGEEDDSASAPVKQQDGSESDSDSDSDEDDDSAPASFGSVGADRDSKKNDKGNKNGKSPFSTLSFVSCSLVPSVPFKLQQSFLSWKNGMPTMGITRSPQSCAPQNSMPLEPISSVSFHRRPGQYRILKAESQGQQRYHKRSIKLSQLHSLSRLLLNAQSSTGRKRRLAEQVSLNHHLLHTAPEIGLHNILSMHTPLDHFPSSYTDNMLK